MNRLLKFFFFASLSGLIFSGCYPQGPDYTEDLDVVYTTYDNEYDFQSKSTYAMPDKIVTDVEIEDGDTTYEYMKDIYAQPILQAIDANMSALGWTKVPMGTNPAPDVFVTPAGMATTHFFYSYWYDWWYGGYGGWYGWYYPPYYTISSYTTGSFFIVMSDPHIDSPINRSPTAWLVAMNGLLTGNGNITRVVDGIDQAFKQSPYLKTN
jgi:hypothetical protein